MLISNIKFMTSKTLYLDNAATSFPKPNSVLKETFDFIKTLGGNPGRSGHRLSVLAGERVYLTREKVAAFLDLSSPERVVFTPGATFALNLVIKTSVKHGSHLLISDMEHNSVLRTVHSLKLNGKCEYSLFDAQNPEDSIEKAVRKNTTHIISTLTSNVNGVVIDVEILSKVAKRHGISLILDASQRLGHTPLSLKNIKFYALCCAAHKSLFGLSGAGFIVFGDNECQESFLEGGSGSDSKSLVMPENLPERFEAGTLPVPSIVSLGAGIDFINGFGLREIESKLDRLTRRFIDVITSTSGIKACQGNSGIIMFTHEFLPSEALADMLDKNGIAVRGGFHCAPLAHKKLGTYETGAVRVSLSCLNKDEDAEKFGKILRRTLKEV